MYSTANGGGWIKLHRALKYSDVYQDSERLHLWLHLLLSANYEPADVLLDNGRVIHLEPGQMLTGRVRLAKETGLDEYKIQRSLKRLELAQQIAQQNYSKYRIITIVKWEEYQGDAQQNAQITASKPPQTRSKKKEVKPIGVSAHVFQQIADVLNDATGKHYKATGSALVKGVSARLSEGFQAADIERVIKHKAGQWLLNPEMSGYLRPETLFGNKFESYLNEAGGPVEAGSSATDDESEKWADILND
jgi:uncharacterized phage protein (TIGR02220 family)